MIWLSGIENHIRQDLMHKQAVLQDRFGRSILQILQDVIKMFLHGRGMKADRGIPSFRNQKVLKAGHSASVEMNPVMRPDAGFRIRVIGLRRAAVDKQRLTGQISTHFPHATHLL